MIRSFQTVWLPGLLQTAEYARLLLPLVDVTGVMDHAAAVVARLERQRLLFRRETTFEFLVTEGALRFSPALE